MRKPRLKPFEVVPFVNNLNHTIQPGDACLIVTSCTQRVRVGVGRYVGLRERSVLVEFDEKRTKFIHNETGTEWEWDTQVPGLELPEAPKYPYSVGWGADRTKAMEEYHRKYTEYNKLHSQYYKDREGYKQAHYHEVVERYIRRSTLQRNRIYPVNMKVIELSGVRF